MNRQRKAKEWIRAYESPERCDWIASRPCVVCKHDDGAPNRVNAHTRGGGGSRKADAKWIVAMCWHEHEELHRVGKATFERTYNINLDALAEQTDAAWKAFCQEAA